MKTGEDVRELGLYASDCCLQEILFDAGDCFSRCPRCMSLSSWEMVDMAPSLEEMQDLKETSVIGKHWTTRSESRVVELRHSL